ncbi:hypothetical protein KUCAC02_020545 [Chaenocephalus aceratus]|nr:hypothetical protein KUCAC02_020545 [Chaenocephalus aceratus]
MDSLTFWLNLSLVAPVDLLMDLSPLATGLYDGATRYANAKPVSKESQSGNPGSIPSGAAPEVISYGYGGYPFGNMDVAPRGRVDGPCPLAVQTRSNPGGLDDGTGPLGGATHSSNVGYPVTNKDQTSINTADGPVPYETDVSCGISLAKTSFMKPNNWRPPFWGFAQWETNHGDPGERYVASAVFVLHSPVQQQLPAGKRRLLSLQFLPGV